ncbi:MAG TPA: SMI1/KNR4 family protein [Myxococcaceae bacterium]|nr:SMI1/KNR4 family protein [Myxococcaceae bacterium]
MQRPPLPFSTLGPPLEPSVIDQFEAHWRVHIPDPYRAFLLRANGAELALPIFHYRRSPQGRIREGSIHALFSINHENAMMDLGEHVHTYIVWSRRIPYDLFPIGTDTGSNLILMGDVGPRLSQIFYWIHDFEASDGEPPTERNVYPVSNSLDEFLASLKPFLTTVK